MQNKNIGIWIFSDGYEKNFIVAKMSTLNLSRKFWPQWNCLLFMVGFYYFLLWVMKWWIEFYVTVVRRKEVPLIPKSNLLYQLYWNNC